MLRVKEMARSKHSNSVVDLEEMDPEISLYRDRTTVFLRKYFRLSVELGRLPSLLGREFFRTRVTSYTMHSFEDAVIFVHDIDRCLERVSPGARAIIQRIIFQDYTHEQAAKLLGRSSRTMSRGLQDAIDEVSQVFLNRGVLQTAPQGAISAARLKALMQQEDARPEIQSSKKPVGSVKRLEAMKAIG